MGFFQRLIDFVVKMGTTFGLLFLILGLLAGAGYFINKATGDEESSPLATGMGAWIIVGTIGGLVYWLFFADLTPIPDPIGGLEEQPMEFIR